jgi:UDP-N-acetylmuramate--alanine ligase
MGGRRPKCIVIHRAPAVECGLAMERPLPQPHAHVVGVAGAGMSAVAELLLGLGYDVTGSDRFLDQGQAMDVLDRLRKAGCRLAAQDGAAVRADAQAVVVSTAIEPDNPDLVAAQRLSVPVVHRAEMIARLARGRRLVAVTGTAGKTTITGLAGFILEQAGFDPTVVNGGAVLNWQAPDRVGNVRVGGSDLWLVEADESDRSLLRFDPEVALISNISKDHFELDEVVKLFGEFAGRVRRTLLGGAGVASVLGRRARDVHAEVVLREGRWRLLVDGREVLSPMMGRHNAENAALAAALCKELGAPPESIVAALGAFRGIHRRLEEVGALAGVRVIDDYAHNPAKIAASWRAAAELGGRVHGYWRPHGFGPLSLMKDELADAFASVCRPDDRLFILPVYYAGGTASKTITSEEFVEALRKRNVPARHVADYEALERELRAGARRGDSVLGMGARDPDLPRFARRLASTDL